MTIRSAAAAAWFICLAFCAIAYALNFPALTGRVVDAAGILDDATKAELTQELEALEQKTTDQVVVVTLPTLGGTAIEDYGYQLGRHWQIGQKGKNNGILLIVVPSERKLRIEVGYGLEGTVTDAISKLIIENSILPRFKAGDYAGGIKRGVEDLTQVLTSDPAEWQQRAERNSLKQDDPGTLPVAAIILAIVCLIIFCATVSGLLCQLIFQALLTPGPPGRSRGYSGGGGSFGGGGGGGFSGGGGSFGGGGASGRW